MIESRKIIAIVMSISLIVNCIGLLLSLNNFIVYKNGSKVHSILREGEDYFSKSVHGTVEKSKAIDRVLVELKFRHEKIAELNLIIKNNYKIVTKNEKIDFIIWSTMLLINVILVILIKRVIEKNRIPEKIL